MLIEKYNSLSVVAIIENLQKPGMLPQEQNSQREEIKQLAILTQKTAQQFSSALETIEAILTGDVDTTPAIIE